MRVLVQDEMPLFHANYTLIYCIYESMNARNLQEVLQGSSEFSGVLVDSPNPNAGGVHPLIKRCADYPDEERSGAGQ